MIEGLHEANVNIHIGQMDNLDLLAQMEDESVDVILTDPPYLYLNHKLDVPFDEGRFFSEAVRVLKDKGFIVLFGRGTSFYRWNTILSDLGMNFKEEVVWNKSYVSSPLMAMGRVHESVSIHTKGKGTINRVKVPYLEMKGHDIGSIVRDIKRLMSVFGNPDSMKAVLDFLKNNVRDTSDGWKANDISISSPITKENRCVSVARSIREGQNEKSIIRTDYQEKTQRHRIGESASTKDFNRCVNVAQAVEFDLNEKSIIKQPRDHFRGIHPTQKPVRLLERLLGLVIPEGVPRENIVVADFFGGSMSTMEAVHNIGMTGIACEIDADYFRDGKNRIELLPARQIGLFE